MMNICSLLGCDWKHLYPVNDWIEDTSGPSYEYGRRVSVYIIDQSTGDRYFNSTNSDIRIKCFLSATAGILLHTVVLIAGTVYRVFRILSFHAFWRNGHSESRFTEWAADATRFLLSPLGIPGLFLSAVYGMIKPRDGEKLHARMEILFHGHPLIAPCMHPQPPDPAHNTSLRRFQAMAANTLLVQPFILVIAIAYKIIRFLSFYSLWKGDYENLDAKCFNWIKDGLSILATPMGIPLCLLIGVFSIAQPEKGKYYFRKVQEICYGEAFADCDFVPIDPREHFFGGSGPSGY